MRLLDDSEVFRLATALRGPDTENVALKEMFTLPIRAKLGVSRFAEYAMFNIRFDTLVKAVLTVCEHDLHFLDHVDYALDVLVKNYMLDEDRYRELTTLINALRQIALTSLTERESVAVNMMEYAMNTIRELIEKSKVIIYV